jgi:molybdate transport system ATP-binding protein
VTLEAHVVAAPSPRSPFTLDAALRVADGEVLAVVGPNGAGKSTLLRALAGLLPVQAGRIAAGSPPAVLDDPAAGVLVPVERRGVGVVFQDHRLFPHLSVLDNVAYPARIAGSPRAAARDEAGRWLRRLGLEALAGRRPGQLSGGQAQRVALARALARRPRMLLLDEPMAGLGREDVERITQLVRKVAEGRTVLMVEHNLKVVATLSDTITVLARGEVLAEGDYRTVSQHPQVIEAYMGTATAEDREHG